MTKYCYTCKLNTGSAPNSNSIQKAQTDMIVSDSVIFDLYDFSSLVILIHLNCAAEISLLKRPSGSYNDSHINKGKWGLLCPYAHLLATRLIWA